MTFVHHRSNPTFPVVFAVATVTVLMLSLVPSDAYAQSAQVLDTLVDSFQTQSKQWEGAIKQAAISLFWILAAIEFSVSAIFLALQGAGAQTFAAELVKRILVIGIFYFILDSGSSICNAIVESLKQLAFNAGGVKSAPSAIFNSGWNICQKILNEVSLWKDAGKAIVLCIAAFIIIVCFALIAAMMIVTLVEVAIVSYAGIILLGFGGSSFTKDYAVKYLTYAVSVGIKIMMMTLVVSVGQSIHDRSAQNFKGDNINEIIIVIGVAVVFLGRHESPSVDVAVPRHGLIGGQQRHTARRCGCSCRGRRGSPRRYGRQRRGPWCGRQGQRRQPSGDSRACDGGRRWVRLQPSCRHARLPDGLRDGQRGFGPAPAEPAATTAAESAALPNGSGIIRRGQPLQLCSTTGLCCLCVALKALLPAGVVRRRQGVALAALAPQGRDRVPPPGVGHVPPPPQVVGVLCQRPHKLGPAMPRPRDSPRRLPLHPNPEARPHSPPQAGPRELLLSAARRRLRSVAVSSPVVAGANQTASPADSSGDGSPAPAASFAPVSTADTAGPTTEGLSADSADTTSSNAAARAPASAGSEVVPAPSGTSPSYTLDRSFGRDRPNHQPACPCGGVHDGAARD